QRLETTAATVAGEMLAEALHFPLGLRPVVVHASDVQHTAAEVQTGLDGIRHAAPLIRAHDQTVDNDFDLVLAAVVDRRRFFDRVGPAVHTHADKSGPANLFPERLVLFL